MSWRVHCPASAACAPGSTTNTPRVPHVHPSPNLMKRKRNQNPDSGRRKTGGADPFAEREALKYARPIASREAILDWLARADRPLSFGQILHDLKLHQAEDV